MKYLLVAFAFIQLLCLGYSDDNFNSLRTSSINSPIYIDNVITKQDPNRINARSTGEDFQVFSDQGVSPIIQEEIHQAIEEAKNDNDHFYNGREHNRFRRNTGPPPRPPPPPPRGPFMPPYITDDIRGFNRRFARDTHLGEQIEPELLRERRDLQIPGYKKPTHHNVIIPNWNPNARTQTWKTIGVRRHRRDLQEEQEQFEVEGLNGDLTEFEEHSRLARGLDQRNGGRRVLINRRRVSRRDSVPRWRNRTVLQMLRYKKPTLSDAIRNWNPNVRTQPRERMGARNRRSYDFRSHRHW